MQNLYKELEAVLLTQDDYRYSDGKLNKPKIMSDATADIINPMLLGLLLENNTMRQHFFNEVSVNNKTTLVFDKTKFSYFISNKEFLPDSYTRYKKKVSLSHNDEPVISNKSVVLNFPYKDCVLVGGQDQDDAKRDEVFFNETLAPDDIDRLLDAKAFTNFKRYSADGVENLEEINKIQPQISMQDNFIIKGNNLLVLHSLKKIYAGKVKLIYIDPPYNVPSKSSANTFCYNNTFKRSTWLVFMKNRLETAKELLRSDGVIVITIDENEQCYLGVLLDEIFKPDIYEKHCITIVHNPRGIQGTNFSYINEYAFFVFKRGMNIIGNRKINTSDIDFSNLRNWGGESLRTDAQNCFYPIIVNKSNNQIMGFGEVCPDDCHPDANIHKDELVEIYPIDIQGIERKWRYARQTIETVKHLLKVKLTKGIYDIQIGKDFGMYRTVWELWKDNKYDSNEYGKKLLNQLVPDNNFSYPKSLYNVYDSLYAVVANDKNAIVLDYHAGSGTTAHAVLQLNLEDNGNRKFILVEQMDYINKITAPRIQKVIQLQKEENQLFTNKHSFIYCELMQYNQQYIEQIKNANSTKELLSIWHNMQSKAQISYLVDIKTINNTVSEFEQLTIDEQKQFLYDVLDKNHLYVNYSEIADSDYKISQADKQLNDNFYTMKDNFQEVPSYE